MPQPMQSACSGSKTLPMQSTADYGAGAGLPTTEGCQLHNPASAPRDLRPGRHSHHPAGKLHMSLDIISMSVL